jgi:hypothetical protein
VKYFDSKVLCMTKNDIKIYFLAIRDGDHRKVSALISSDKSYVHALLYRHLKKMMGNRDFRWHLKRATLKLQNY